MKLFLKSRGSGGSRRRRITGLAIAASLILPTGLVAAAGLAASPASATITPSATAGSSYTAITPCRIADTRPYSGYQGQTNTLVGGGTLNVVVAGACNGSGTGVPDFNTWSSAPSLPSARYDFSAVSTAGRIYEIGGDDAVGAATKSVMSYTPWLQPRHGVNKSEAAGSVSIYR